MPHPGARLMGRIQSREAERARLRRLRALERENADLRKALGAMLDDAEEMALSYYPAGRGQLDSILAHEMRYGEDECARYDLRRIKAARRALGLPAWWDR